MITRGISKSHLLSSLLLYMLTVSVSSFTYERTATGRRHFVVRRSHPSYPYEGPPEPHMRESLLPPSSLERGRHIPSLHHEVPEPDPGYPSLGDDALGKALGENGLTRVLYEEEQVPPDEEYYYDDNLFLPPSKHNLEKQQHNDILPVKEENESFPKKFPKDDKEIDPKKHDLHPAIASELEPKPQGESQPEHESVTHAGEPRDSGETESPVTEPSIPIYVPRFMKKDSPHVLPVTTEGRKTEDPLKVYGFPKELLPIMPGGGSRFEDVEREKLEKKKMSQTKGTDDDSAENGGAHEAEGLYSSASLSSISLCIYWLIGFHHLDRLLML